MPEIPKQALAIVADFIVKERHGTNWAVMADLVDYDLGQNPRLVRSQMFRDDDYPTCVLKFLKDMYRHNPENAKFAIGRILQEGNEEDALKPEYRAGFEALGIIAASGIPAPAMSSIVITRYLDVESFPDDFYKELAAQINACYQYSLYPAAQILIRKMLENCLIDILRKTYGMSNLSLFYDASKGRFLDFSVLLDNTGSKIGDFTSVKDSFNKDILKQVDDFRDQGNSSAHNINLDIHVVKSELDTNRSKLNFVVKSLFRTIVNIKT